MIHRKARDLFRDRPALGFVSRENVRRRPAPEMRREQPGQVHRIRIPAFMPYPANGTQICAASPQMNTRRSRNLSARRRRPIQSSLLMISFEIRTDA
jgi:hypothetical protein